MAVHECLRVESPDFYQDQILQTRANKKKCINVHGDYIRDTDISVE
jgi:hypothetical protein